MPQEQALSSLGRRIRLLRQEQSVTMQDLADRARISRSWLGSIERGSAAPSIDIVRQLANALDTSVGSLLGHPNDRVTESSHVEDAINLIRQSERLAVRFPSQSHFWEVLTPLRGEHGILTADLQPTNSPAELSQHEGQESYVVLAGQVVIRVGDREYELDEGDCVTFPATITHGIVNRGPGTATVLNVTTPSDFGARRQRMAAGSPGPTEQSPQSLERLEPGVAEPGNGVEADHDPSADQV